MSVVQERRVLQDRARLPQLPGWLRGGRAAIVLLLLIGAVSMARQWDGHILWDPDSLFYQAKVVQIRTGASQNQAIHQVFSSPLTGYMRSLEAAQPASVPELLAEPHWATFSAPFYARRLLVPAMASAIYPIFGLRSLKLLSMFAYVLLGPLLYALLRQRFRASVSVGAAAVCLLIPTVRNWATFGLTDTWSLSIEVAALITAVRFLDGGRRWWLLGWIAALLASSVTHDAAFVPALAAGVVCLARRNRRSLVLFLTGVAACLPATRLAAVNENVALASAFSHHGIPQNTSWSWVLSHYLGSWGDMVSSDLSYAVHHPVTGLLYAVGLILALALVLRRRHDAALLVIFGVCAGYLLQLVLGPAYSVFRYELELVPVLALGFAWGIERGIALTRERDWAGFAGLHRLELRR